MSGAEDSSPSNSSLPTTSGNFFLNMFPRPPNDWYLLCILYNDKFVIAQKAHHGACPAEAGASLYNFLAKPVNIMQLKYGIPHIHIPTQDQMEYARKADNFGAAAHHIRQWAKYSAERHGSLYYGETNILNGYPCLSLLDDTGTAILELVSRATSSQRLPVLSSLDFVNDAANCEWTYVVNLDLNQIEIFRGWFVAQEKTPGHRFRDVGKENAPVPGLIMILSFSELQNMSRDDFVRTVEYREVSINPHVRSALHYANGATI